MVLSTALLLAAAAFAVAAVWLGRQWASEGGGGIDVCDAAKFETFRSQLQQYDGDARFDLESESLLGECAVRSTYAAARALFRESAEAAGFELSSIPVHGQEYVTDVAILRGHPKRFLLHVSGIHGVEGYAGSAAQVTALQYFAGKTSKRRAMFEAVPDISAPTVVFVHAINPFGMANNRRVNEGNIDVNRNFLSDEQLAAVKSRDPNFAGYVDIDFLLNPVSQIGTVPGWVWLSDIHGLLKVLYAVWAVGIGSIKRSLVAGNYYKPLGMGFGGYERSSSVEVLINLSKQLGLDKAEKVVLLDVHTGLGPSGKDTLVYFGSENAEREAQFRRIFPLERRAGGGEGEEGEIIGGMKESSKGTGEGSAMAGYELTVGTTDDFCRDWMAPHLGDENRVCVTQEFGTVAVVQVGKALMDENYAFHYGSLHEKAVYGERLKACFFVQTTAWARAVAHRGAKVIMQAFDDLVG